MGTCLIKKSTVPLDERGAFTITSKLRVVDRRIRQQPHTSFNTAPAWNHDDRRAGIAKVAGSGGDRLISGTCIESGL
jgi:hypothetical protein